MPSKTTLNAKNLEELGSQKLAELLIEVARGNANAQRRLRMALAEAQSPDELAQSLRKRMATIARSTSSISWRQRKKVAADLNVIRSSITESVAEADPSTAFELILRFLHLGDGIIERSRGNADDIAVLFSQGCEDLTRIAASMNMASELLADTVFDLLDANGYGQLDSLIAAASDTLGAKGRAHLKSRISALSREPIAGMSPRLRASIDQTVNQYLQSLADAEGDVDAFIAAQGDGYRKSPGIALEIAQRLMENGRKEEALDTMLAVPTGSNDAEFELAKSRLLRDLGRTEEAAQVNQRCFEAHLDADHLRQYLKSLDNFDDIQAEKHALSYALNFSDVHLALAFFILWPALDKAATLIVERLDEFDGERYQILSDAAVGLSSSQPLAATLLYRLMIDDTLGHNRRRRLRHAARHLENCAALARKIENFADHPDHESYTAILRENHRRSRRFWGLVQL